MPLTPDQDAALLAAHAEGASTAETADRLGVSVDAVKRARARLGVEAPERVATSGTRHGQGEGWGGMANGGGDKPAAEFELGNQAAVGRPEESEVAEWKRQTEWVLLLRMERMSADENYPDRAYKATHSLLERVGTPVVKRVEMTGADGGPLETVTTYQLPDNGRANASDPAPGGASGDFPS